ncbi:hypothetical protein OF83DRAFT_1083500 [Amylostereum chailletii]|nr:hypothetical protein OF83DRAFT_1083500 [Amylostereum chailletii]
MSLPTPSSSSLSFSSAPPPSSTVLVPKPFPSPALADVPVGYIVQSLLALAPRYWGNIESSDCCILFPLDIKAEKLLTRGLPLHHFPDYGQGGGPPAPRRPRPSEPGRRATEPIISHAPPTWAIKLHTDYLSAHSALLRALFSCSSSLDLGGTTSFPYLSSIDNWTQRPRLLSSFKNAIAFVPVPDPSSFKYLIQWMYFGDFTPIRLALLDETITWRGIASNAHYLRMSSPMMKWLGEWRTAQIQASRRFEHSDEYETDLDEGDSDEEDLARGRSQERKDFMLGTPPATS